jgi:hypothetical protein
MTIYDDITFLLELGAAIRRTKLLRANPKGNAAYLVQGDLPTLVHLNVVDSRKEPMAYQPRCDENVCHAQWQDGPLFSSDRQ